MPTTGHHHRSGGLKQSNKKNKRSNASKRSVSRNQGGKVNATVKVKGGGGAASASAQAAQSKADRRNHQTQLRDKKRADVLRKRRGMMAVDSGKGHGNSSSGSKSHKGLPNTTTLPPPRIVGIVSLGSARSDLEDRVRRYIASSADHVVDQAETTMAAAAAAAATHCKFDVHKKEGRLTILTVSSVLTADGQNNHDDFNNDDAAVMAALDMARICDVQLFVIDGNASPNIAHQITEIQLPSTMSDQASTRTGKSTHTQQDWDHLISTRGDRILAAVKGQGLPTPLTILAHTEDPSLDDDDDLVDHMTFQSTKSIRRSAIKRKLDLKKYVSRFATTEFGTNHDKVVEITLNAAETEAAEEEDDGMNDTDELELEQDRTAAGTTATSQTGGKSSTASNAGSATLVRTLCTMSCSPPKWVAHAPRAYLVSHTHDYNAATRDLHLTGYVRGPVPLDVNALFHVPNVGTFACRHIQRAVPPLAKPHHTSKMVSDGEGDDGLVQADPMKRESLHMYATPDALEGEQNLIGFDEAEEEGVNDDDEAFARPAGWSDYQSAWLDAVDQDVIDSNDNGELAEALNKKTSAASIATDGMDMDMDEANEVSESERQALLQQRKKQHSEENDFPDEVQVQEDEKARDRFARYRSLKSFRKSHWDPKENLPDSYASIYHFSSFKRTQRTVMNDMKDLAREAGLCHNNFFGQSPPKTVEEGEDMADEDNEDDDYLEGCVPSGSYVTLTLEAVPPEAMSDIAPHAFLTVVSLLAHENKVSVLHMGLSQSLGCDKTNEKYPIKSKDVLTFRCGWRTWKGRPVFSQNNLNCDKHKFERFLPTGGAFFAGSVFGPVTYTPCPVLVFRDRNDETVLGAATREASQNRELVAIGSMIGADADRIVVKRIVLTGYPVRVHKRHATVKYMFYEPDDVKWFMPAGLHTKHGLQGNIVQSVGEHGTMKCLFNAPIKQHDTVCLPLYKRIYPKYAIASDASDDKSRRGGATTYRESKDNLIVL